MKWKAWKVHYFNKRASNSLALYRCATAMEVTAKCSADHLENAGVLIDTAMSCRGQRPKECLTVVLMVCIFLLILTINYIVIRNSNTSLFWLICHTCWLDLEYVFPLRSGKSVACNHRVMDGLRSLLSKDEAEDTSELLLSS